MKVPKRIILETQLRMCRDMRDGATLAQTHDTWMINLKYSYRAAKDKAAEYGFVPESRGGAYQGPTIHQCKSKSVKR